MASNPRPIVFIALTVLTLGASAGVGYWQFGRVQAVQAKVDRLNAEASSRAELEEEVKASAGRLQEGLKLITHLEKNLSTFEYIPTLLRDLQQTGEACNLQIIAVRPVPKASKQPQPGGADEGPKVRKPYEEIDVEVKSKGSFENAMTFLRRLEDFPKVVGVRHLSITPKTGADGRSIAGLETTMLIRVYVFPNSNSNKKQATHATASAAEGGTS